MADGKKSFVLYADLLDNIEHLTNEEKGILFNHLLEYVNDKNPILEDRILVTAWKPIEKQLKRDLKKFEEVKTKRSEAGKRSAELRALKTNEQTSTNSTSVESVKQTSTNSTDNDKCNMIYDNVNVNDICNTIYKDIFDFWNSQKIIVHKNLPNEKVFKDALKIATLEEIKESITNYKKILCTSDFYFKHNWTLETFLKKQNGKDNHNFKRFLDNGDIFTSFNNRKPIKSQKNKVLKIDNNDYDNFIDD